MKNVEIKHINDMNNDINDSSKSKSKIQISRVNIFLFIPYLG